MSTPIEQTPTDLPYPYFVSYITDTGASNVVFNRAAPISTAADITGIQDLISAKLTTDPSHPVKVVILSFRLMAESDDVIQWAYEAFPVLTKLVAEIDQIPDNHAFFEVNNFELAKSLVKSETSPYKQPPEKDVAPLQKETPPGPVGGQPVIESGKDSAESGT